MSEREIVLDGAMTIAKAEATHSALEALFLAAEPTKLDVSAVSRADTSILQLLVSFIQSMEAAGVEVSWGGISDEFKASAKILGLESALRL